MIKYTPQYLKKLEEIFDENSFKIRYEKGNFKSGYCLIDDRKMVIVNKFASLESRITTLHEILKVVGELNSFTGDKFIQVRKQLLKQDALNEESTSSVSDDSTHEAKLEESTE